MNIKTAHIILLFGLLSATCGSVDEISESQVKPNSEVNINQYQDNSSSFKEVSLESQTTFPGAYSNLKGITKYELSFNVDITEGIEFKRLMVDQVALPFSALIINGQKQSGFEIKESSNSIRLTAFRNLYNSDPSAPKSVEEEKYEPSGLSLENSAVVEYFKDGKPYYLEIENIKILPGIYAP